MENNQTNKKYELLKHDTKVVKDSNGNDVVVFRIRALRDFVSNDGFTVTAGALGGYISYDGALCHEGGCWIDETSMIYECSSVKGEAYINDSTVVRNGAVISGDIWASKCLLDGAIIAAPKGEHPKVYLFKVTVKDSIISGNADIVDAIIETSSTICNASIYGPATTLTNVGVFGDKENQVIIDNSKITSAMIRERAFVADAEIEGGTFSGDTICALGFNGDSSMNFSGGVHLGSNAKFYHWPLLLLAQRLELHELRDELARFTTR